ncbi:MAG TPA: alpha/beta hydrolase [Streptosporangiaceae bacterium]|nr:alpha/beta hydrolase [Streptosporangiaceae bacterium]
MASSPASLHPQAVRFLELLAEWAPPPGQRPSVEEMRRNMWREPYLGDVTALPLVADRAVAGPAGEIPVRVYSPAPDRALPALVYFHGGGWALGDIDAVDPLCRDLARLAGCVVVNVGYRLAPEHPFPAAVDDSWAVTADLIADPGGYGVDPGAVAVAGDSAGGNLAAVVAARARDEGVALAHQLLVYPVLDTAMDTPSYAEFAQGFGLDADGMAWFVDLYAGAADRSDPRLAPLRTPDLTGLAPATVITAECDVLRDEGEVYAGRLAAAGVDVALRRFDGMVHAFFVLPEIFDAAQTARDWAVARLRAAFAATRQGDAA